MFFDSTAYLLFIFATASLFFLIDTKKSQKLVLLAASFLFLLFLGHNEFLFLSLWVVLNYFLTKFISTDKKLIGAVIFVNILATSLVITDDLFSLNKMIYALGLSIILLQTLTCWLDIFENANTAKLSFIDYALYIVFFPKVQSGPIERPHDFTNKINESSTVFISENILAGIGLILWGLIKKNLIVDRLSVLIDPVYVNPERFNDGSLYTLTCVLLTYIQVYLNLSAYTDIARGTAKLFNIELSQNFNHPFRAKNINDFWSRNNISVSLWFKDYLFTPLAIYKQGKFWQIFSLVITFAICGLWHGLQLKFLIWGLLHGLVIVLLHIKNKTRGKSRPGVQNSVITFLVVSFFAVLIKAENLQTVSAIWSQMFKINDLKIDFLKSAVLAASDYYILILCFVGYFAFEHFSLRKIIKNKPMTIVALFALFVLWTLLRSKYLNFFTYLSS